jgi:hypothetical protein
MEGSARISLGGAPALAASVARPRVVAATAVCALVAFAALGAQSAFGAFEIAKWEAGTCTENSEAAPCTAETPSKYYTQAAGHPNYGITDFRLKTSGLPGFEKPEGNISEARVDLPAGLSVNPYATPRCALSELESSSGCPADTQVGEVQLTAHLNLVSLLGAPVGATVGPPLTNAAVYNMQPPLGTPLEADFKVAIFNTVVRIVGGIDWSGDYHEYFTIKEIPTTPELVEGRLIFFGKTLGSGGTLPFITMPSTCLGPQTTELEVESYEGQREEKSFTTPVGASGCEKVPFAPTVNVTPATTQSDAPYGVTIKVEVPQNPSPESIDSSMPRNVSVSLPEGMTLNPAAAAGLQACTSAQFGKGTTSPVACPMGSQIGTATIETPDLPSGTLAGPVYVGQPENTNPESGGEYRIFIDAEAPSYGVSVRLEGRVAANAATGRLTTAVLEVPQVPFSDFSLALNTHTPLANPLVCGAATTDASLVPYSGGATAEPFMSFPVDFDGKGGACPSPLPFSLAQSASVKPTTAGATTSFALGISRADGQQYLSRISTKLPPGLLGKIPAVTLCGEPQAALGSCSPASEIGNATVTVGSGPSPLTLSGTAYLTGPYEGAPYGLSVAVPADKIGPYSYGTIVTRASIAIDPYTAQVIVTSQLPTIVGGAPLRLKTLTVSVTRPGFMINPTNCGPLDTTTMLTSTEGTTQNLQTQFQATGCDSLPFKPRLTASSKAKTSRADGAALSVNVHYPGGVEANISSVKLTLPKILPVRQSALNNACREALFAAGPAGCPHSARVGEVTVTTPVLPGKLTGYALLVSHGGAAFPNLDLVLSGDGVTVILVGDTNISPSGITTSDFAALPDVPISSFQTRLPTGPNAALAAKGNLCKGTLQMPTTIVAQNGKVVKQNTKIAVSGCPRKRHRATERRH